MRRRAALDLMGLQAVRQGQITNNWLKQGPDYWLRKIEDKQLFLRLPRHPPHPTPPGLRHTAETLLYLWWSMGETPGPSLQELLLPLSACVASPRSKRYTWIFFFFFRRARQQFLKQARFAPADFDKRSVWICEHQHVFKTGGNHSYRYHFHFTT